MPLHKTSSIMFTDSIKPNLFFIITYKKKSTGEQERYILRTGVRRWKNIDGTVSEVKGTGRETKPGYLTAYCANRKCYRSFIIDNILQIKQGKTIINFQTS